MLEQTKTVVLDVRDEIRQGGEPFQRIMSTVNSLGPEQEPELWAPFEPKPLFGVMAGMGYQHDAQPESDGDWRDQATEVRLVWDPLWTPEMITDEGRQALGWAA